MNLEHQDYRTFLKSALSARIEGGKSLSLRGLAGKVGVSPSLLSEMFTGKKNLSVELAFKLAVKLGLSDSETQRLCLLVQLENEKDPSFREEFLRRLNHLNPQKKIFDLSADMFRVIANWYHFAILELTHLPDSRLHPESIAKKLGISKIDAELAVERLLRLELLEKDRSGSYRKSKDYVVAQSQVPNGAMKQFHRECLEKAIASLETQTPKRRISATDILPLNSKYLPDADRLSQEFSDSILKLTEKPGTKDSVYALSVHFFQLTKGNGEKT